jgi:hypothetical protein
MQRASHAPSLPLPCPAHTATHTWRHTRAQIIRVEANNNVRKQILRELQIMHKCKSPYIVSFHGAFLNEGDISICMEFMDCGALDSIYRHLGPFPEVVAAKASYAVLRGLTYLYEEMRIIHRDIKPSNILINRAGDVKIADFGVSGQLVNSMANTFVGTSAYMSVGGVVCLPWARMLSLRASQRPLRVHSSPSHTSRAHPTTHNTHTHSPSASRGPSTPCSVTCGASGSP